MTEPDDEQDEYQSLRQTLAQLGGSLDALDGVGMALESLRDLEEVAHERRSTDDYEPCSPVRLLDAYSITYEDPEKWVPAAQATLSIFDEDTETRLLPVPSPVVAQAISKIGAEVGSDPRATADPESPYAHRVRAPSEFTAPEDDVDGRT